LTLVRRDLTYDLLVETGPRLEDRLRVRDEAVLVLLEAEAGDRLVLWHCLILFESGRGRGYFHRGGAESAEMRWERINFFSTDSIPTHVAPPMHIRCYKMIRPLRSSESSATLR